MRRSSKPKWVKELALKRIVRLLELAEENLKKHPERSHRYVELTKKLSSKYNVTIPREQKRKICKKCDAFLVPGFNLSIRADRDSKAMVYTCLECGHKKKYVYK
jgi:ribonuclease P protein subunit RPR2